MAEEGLAVIDHGGYAPVTGGLQRLLVVGYQDIETVRVGGDALFQFFQIQARAGGGVGQGVILRPGLARPDQA